MLVLMLVLLYAQAATANPPIIPQGSEGWLGWIVRNALPLTVAVAVLRYYITKDVTKRYDETARELKNTNDRIGLKPGSTVEGALNGMGDRVAIVEDQQKAQGEAQRSLQRTLDAQTTANNRLHADFGALQQLLQQSIAQTAQGDDRLVASIHEADRAAGERDAIIRERLSALEARNDLGAAIEKAITGHADSLNKAIRELRDERRTRE